MFSAHASPFAAMTATPLDAVTALLMHQGQLLMVHRADALKSFAGFWAFPGGKVDAEDRAVSTPAAWCPSLPPALAAALARELHEETTVLIATPGLVQRCDLLGTATTPAMMPVRFATRFYRLDLNHQPTVVHCPQELAAARWASPQEWLAEYHAGRLLLAPPTLDALQQLAADPECRAFTNFEDDRLPDEAPALRCIEPLHGLYQIAVRSHTLPPATHTNAWLFGDRYKVLVDPSPNSPEEYQRLKNLIDRIGIDEIFLTHHHPDHRQYANELAQHYDLPLSMSEDCVKRINTLQPGWFGSLTTVRTYAEGDVITRWLGKPVRVLSVPGHDQGQLALMPDSREWCLAGDLFQGVGTVVISAPEGHMGRYFASLQRIIDLQPAVILPSHGQACGGTHRLEETLAHRKMREATILTLHRRSQTPAQMLAAIYPELHAKLIPLAERTIAAHLVKLEEEGQIAAA